MSGKSSAEKTEQPTPKRLRDLRKKGQVPVSREVVSTSLVIVLLGYLYFDRHRVFDRLVELATAPARFYGEPFDESLKTLLDLLVSEMLYIVAPMLLAVVSVTFLANVLQNGIVTSAEPLKLDPKKIDPVQGFKRIFSMINFVEFVKSIVKVAIVGGCVYLVMSRRLESMINGPFCSLDCLVSALGTMLLELIAYCSLAFVVVAGADLAFQRHAFTKRNRMTKDEVKRDRKETDGDPIIKGRRRQLQRQIAEGEQLEQVKRASVVVRNPTHYAVAIRYDAEDAPLPYVMAKGENRLAEAIIRVAEEHGIPVMENVPLARGLYGSVGLNAFIPLDFIPAVVEALHWVKTNHPHFRHAD